MIKEFNFVAMVSIAVCSVPIMCYRILVNAEFLKEFLFGERLSEKEEFSYFLFIKYSGVIILGIIPGLIFIKLLPHSDYGLSFPKGVNDYSFYWMLVLAPVIIMVNWLVAISQKTCTISTPIFIKRWEPRPIAIYFIACSVYLFAFELLFRGFLFFSLINSMDVVPAISINLLIYAISQTPKRLPETIGNLLLSLVLCIATVQTGTIWVAFLLHVVSTLSHNLFALFFHPEMRVVKRSAEDKFSDRIR